MYICATLAGMLPLMVCVTVTRLTLCQSSLHEE